VLTLLIILFKKKKKKKKKNELNERRRGREGGKPLIHPAKIGLGRDSFVQKRITKFLGFQEFFSVKANNWTGGWYLASEMEGMIKRKLMKRK